MKKQKICIIGDGLTGLVSDLVLSKLDLDIDLVSKNTKIKKFIDTRTTALSDDNFTFLSKYLNKNELRNFWPCKKVNLFYESENKFLNFMNFENAGKNIMYIIQNNKIKEIILKIIKKKKNIKLINGEVKKVSTQDTSIFVRNKKIFYDLVLLCLGKGSNISLNLIGERNIKENFNEKAFTSLVTHNSDIIYPKQYFLKEGPLAILPINKKKFSFVWSVEKKYEDAKIKNLIPLKLKELTKNKILLNNIQIYPISFNFNTNFFNKNFLILGEGSYSVHPIAGQGFNLILRDIRELFDNINNHLSLGLQIKDSSIFKKFVQSRKPENLIFSLGINLTNKFFKNQKSTALIKDIILKDIDQFKFLKSLSLKISNKGIFK